MNHKTKYRQSTHGKAKAKALRAEKQKMINMFMKKCKRCGATDNLCLHHPNPLQAHYKQCAFNKLGWDMLKAQLSVTVCLCIPCHMTVHRWFDIRRWNGS